MRAEAIPALWRISCASCATLWNDEPLRGCTKILLFVKLGTFAEKLAREVSGEVGGSMPENAVEDYRFTRRVWSIALCFRQRQSNSGLGGKLTVRITIFLSSIGRDSRETTSRCWRPRISASGHT
jgi:hypothetical protein